MTMQKKEMECIRIKTTTVPDKLGIVDNLIYSLAEWNKMLGRKEIKEQLLSGTLYLTSSQFINKDNLTKFSIISPEDVLATITRIEIGYIEVVPINVESKIALEKYIKAGFEADMRYSYKYGGIGFVNNCQLMYLHEMTLICFDMLKN